MFTNLTDGSYVREQDISGLLKLIGIDFNENDWREIHYSEPLNEWDDWEAYFKLIEPSTFISCLKNQYSNPTAASIVDGLVAKYLLEEDQHLLVDGKEPKELPKVRAKKGQQ